MTRTGPRLVVLGYPQPLNRNRWKDDLAEDAAALGWPVTHLPTAGTPCEQVVEACKGADLMIWARTHRHNPVGDIEGMLRRIEDAGTVTVALHLDLYWGIPNRAAQVGRSPWWTCQLVCTADGGHENEFAARGVVHHWCPPAIGSRWLGRGDPDRAQRRIVFVGGCGRSHGSSRAQLLQWAAARFPSFAWIGRDSQHQVWGTDLADLYTGAWAVLGDSVESAWYWSNRVPITCGMGGLLTHPRTRGLAEQGFTDQTMILFDRDDLDELGDRIASITPRRRRDMTDAAIAVVAERHLWRHRLVEIERLALS